jgi:predicted nucleic acid-binding protein
VDVVLRELAEGRRRGRGDADFLERVAASGIVEIMELNDSASLHFERLVIGAAATTLDDGEAATIAFAVAHGGVAILDEKKATRLCAQIFPGLCVGSTVDLLANPAVRLSLGPLVLADAVFNALQHGRMRVFPKNIQWIIDLIGPERVAVCASLPNSIRKAQQEIQTINKTIKE